MQTAISGRSSRNEGICLALDQTIRPSGCVAEAADWRCGLPALADAVIALREPHLADAAALVHHISDATVLRYIEPCPSTAVAFRQFIRWARAERRRGRFACYAIVPTGSATPVGLLEVWPIERNFSVAEWGFVVGRRYWGTGLFARSARLLLDAMFIDGLLGPPGVSRLEARAADVNGRGNAALMKLGATREGLLRGGVRNGEPSFDHAMWSILASEWPALRNRTASVGEL